MSLRTLTSKRKFLAITLLLSVVLVATPLYSLAGGSLGDDVINSGSGDVRYIYDDSVEWNTPILKSDIGKNAEPEKCLNSWGIPTSWTGCISEIFNGIIHFITTQVIAKMIIFAATLMQTMIELSVSLVSSPLIKTGFDITLAVANLGFVLAIILIAFTTILRLEGYETKKLLRNLIIAAILVNFSLSIAGVFIDFTNVFSEYFIPASTPANTASSRDAFGESLASAMKLQKTTATDGSAGTEGFLDLSFSLIMSLLLTFFIGLVFLGLSIMLLVRYIALAILLILMPLVWLFWVIPSLKSYWDQWWHAFLKWTFFLPAVTFFFYLGILSTTAIGKLVDDTIANSSASSAASAANQLVIQRGGVAGILDIIISVSIFMAALVVGSKLGVTGANVALAGAAGVKKQIIGGVTKFGGGVTGWKKGALGRLAEKGGRKTATMTARIPIVGRTLGHIAPNIRKEKNRLEAEKRESEAQKIDENIQSGKTPLATVHARANSRWKSFLPYARRSKAANTLALARNRYGAKRDKETGKITDPGVVLGREIEEKIQVPSGKTDPATGAPIMTEKIIKTREKGPELTPKQAMKQVLKEERERKKIRKAKKGGIKNNNNSERVKEFAKFLEEQDKTPQNETA